MRRAFLLALFLQCPVPAQAAESAYTKVNFETDCKAVSEDELGGTWTCKGYREWKEHFSEGDLRQSAFYGYVGPWFDKGAFESFGHFNHAGETIEWRLSSGAPYATIRRWFVQGDLDDAGEAGEVQVLVISKVGQKDEGDACVVGYIEATATPNANVLAREIADTKARDFACRQDEPQWYGIRKSEQVVEMRNFTE